MGTTGYDGRGPGSPENSSLGLEACPSTPILASIKDDLEDIKSTQSGPPWLPTSLPVFTLQHHQKSLSSAPTQLPHTTKNSRCSYLVPNKTWTSWSSHCHKTRFTTRDSGTELLGMVAINYTWLPTVEHAGS